MCPIPLHILSHVMEDTFPPSISVYIHSFHFCVYSLLPFLCSDSYRYPKSEPPTYQSSEHEQAITKLNDRLSAIERKLDQQVQVKTTAHPQVINYNFTTVSNRHIHIYMSSHHNARTSRVALENGGRRVRAIRYVDTDSDSEDY